ncbi:unnamed protein product [Paramecium sonneborni]|uniref:Uncharacterized protein n=1 Tax=Paramecium sonneborni TaxID=65129 RepID=A0A8S1R0C1_9CILI|nr:unnamed protein product [Paramecium sonneborni]
MNQIAKINKKYNYFQFKIKDRQQDYGYNEIVNFNQYYNQQLRIKEENKMTGIIIKNQKKDSYLN